VTSQLPEETVFDRKSFNLSILLFLLTISPFYLNDIFYILYSDVSQYSDIFIEYSSHLLSLFLILIFSKLRSHARERHPSFDWPGFPITVFIVFGSIVVIAIGNLISHQGYIPKAALYSPEKYSPHEFWLTDLVIRLLFLTFVSEILFRRIAYNILSHVIHRTYFLIVVSGFIYGLCYWSQGLAFVFSNSFTGMVLMWIYVRSQSLAPIVLIQWILTTLGAYSNAP